MKNADKVYNDFQNDKACLDKNIAIFIKEISDKETIISEKDKTIELQKTEIDYLTLSLDSANQLSNSLKEQLTELETKLHKVGQTQQTVFLPVLLETPVQIGFYRKS